MADILSYNVYVPNYKVALKDLHAFYGKPGRPRSRTLAVPALDEDVVTLADAAARPLVDKDTAADIGAVVIATLSPPFQYKKVSVVIAQALGLPTDVRCYDIAGSPSAGSDALDVAANLVSNGEVKKALVVAADIVPAADGDECEILTSAGAVALLLAGDGGFCSLGKRARSSLDVFDIWQLPGDERPRYRLDTLGVAYSEAVRPAMAALFAKAGTEVSDYAQVIFQQPHPGALRGVQKSASDEQTKGSSVVASWGNFFAASLPMGLALAFDAAKAQDKLLAVAYGAGEGEAFEILINSDPPALGTAAILEKGATIDVGQYWRFIQGRDGR